MAQRQIINEKIKQKLNKGDIKTVSTQTGNSNELIIYLSDNKSIRDYYSNGYKEVVLSFNFGSKSFIITKPMLLIFKKNFYKIDSLLNE
jgi:hypothetical protein